MECVKVPRLRDTPASMSDPSMFFWILESEQPLPPTQLQLKYLLRSAWLQRQPSCEASALLSGALGSAHQLQSDSEDRAEDAAFQRRVAQVPTAAPASGPMFRPRKCARRPGDAHVLQHHAAAAGHPPVAEAPPLGGAGGPSWAPPGAVGGTPAAVAPPVLELPPLQPWLAPVPPLDSDAKREALERHDDCAEGVLRMVALIGRLGHEQSLLSVCDRAPANPLKTRVAALKRDMVESVLSLPPLAALHGRQTRTPNAHNAPFLVKAVPMMPFPMPNAPAPPVQAPEARQSVEGQQLGQSVEGQQLGQTAA